MRESSPKRTRGRNRRAVCYGRCVVVIVCERVRVDDKDISRSLDDYASANADANTVKNAAMTLLTSQNAISTKDDAPLCCCCCFAEPLGLAPAAVMFACFEPGAPAPEEPLTLLVPADAVLVAEEELLDVFVGCILEGAFELLVLADTVLVGAAPL